MSLPADSRLFAQCGGCRPARFTADCARWLDKQLVPRASELARRAKAAALGDALHVELRLGEELARERDAQAIAIGRQTHAGMAIEQPRQVPSTGPRELSERCV